MQREWVQAERAAGIHRFDEPHALDIGAGHPSCASWIRPARLAGGAGLELLRKSKALIVNVDYPLGFAAYHLSVATSNIDLAGVYVMGKAASLNGRVGDVMIPNVVYDEHSQPFLFKNTFLSQHVTPICATARCSITRRP